MANEVLISINIPEIEVFFTYEWKHYIISYILLTDKNFHEVQIMMRLQFITKQGPYLHPGFLSFGCVRNYTLISPSFPSYVLTLVLRLVE
ncbi:hypothetical protein LCGC14_1622940 [marine sediment metagenome]|uniref:Uncharacterized protein n=1 Tax=marine sediment metagenome TaxID=412755 RepID=A0A0F9I558_9ZZZZ